MEPSIAFATGAEDNALALWAASQIDANLAQASGAQRDFAAMRAAVVLVAPDRRLSVTLRFDLGQLTIHDGMIGVPDITLCGDYEVLMGLEQLPISRWGRLPLPAWSTPAASKVAWRRWLVELLSGELKIYGLVAHPRLTARVLRLLNRPSGAGER